MYVYLFFVLCLCVFSQTLFAHYPQKPAKIQKKIYLLFTRSHSRADYILIAHEKSFVFFAYFQKISKTAEIIKKKITAFRSSIRA